MKHINDDTEKQVKKFKYNWKTNIPYKKCIIL